MFKLNAISWTILTACSGLAYASTPSLPQNGEVVVGAAAINTSGDKMTIDQSTPKAQINWNSFDIGKNNEVEFKQPSEMAVAYNRVTGGNASQIAGKLTSNGKVYLANPNGVLVTKGAEVNVGGLLVTTKDLEQISEKGDKDKFTRKLQKEGQIRNQGKITAKGERAFVVLVGDDVVNEGEITAERYYHKETKRVKGCHDDPWSWNGKTCYDYEQDIVKSTSGDVNLSSGENVTFTLRDGYIDVALDENTVKSIIKNEGIITTDGDITLTAKARNQALDSLIINDGVLQANQVVSKKVGTVVLSAGDIQLNEKSDIKAENLHFSEPATFGLKENIKVSSQKGAKVTTPNLHIKGKTVHLTGDFGRQNNTDLYTHDQTLKSTVHIQVPNTEDIRIADKDNGGAGSFIQTDALSSLLANNGRVNMQGNGFDISGNINIDSFKKTDGVLKITNQGNINIHNANINSTGRLFMITSLQNTVDFKSNISINDSKFNLGNGAIGLGRSASSRDFLDDRHYKVEDKQRKKFNVDMNNVEFSQVDDVVVVGGFDKVNLNHINATGQTNFYIDSGNTREYMRYKRGKQEEMTLYEYGVLNLDTRTQLSRRNQNRARWISHATIEDDIHREYNLRYDLFAAKFNNRAPVADTEINISNSNIKLNNGFVHLMAEKIKLDNSNIDIAFNKDNSMDESTQFNRIGFNGKVAMKNSHIKAVGEEKSGISPNPPYAAMFLVGELEGEKSSIFVKSHQGYAFRTDGDSRLTGKNNKDDLKITAITTGGRMGAEVMVNGLPGSIDNDANSANMAFTVGDAARTKTVIENATITALAPNGGTAYLSFSEALIDVKPSADFTFFELPRNKNLNQADIKGNSTKLNSRDFARLYDRINGVKASSLSAEQLGVADASKLSLRNSNVENLDIENLVSITVCDENNQCEDRMLGKKTDSRVSVGEILSE